MGQKGLARDLNLQDDPPACVQYGDRIITEINLFTISPVPSYSITGTQE